MASQIDGMLKLEQVLKLVPVSKSAWYAGVKSGRYPAPVRISPRRVAWRLESIQSLIESFKY